jgi:hypothetical protein
VAIPEGQFAIIELPPHKLEKLHGMLALALGDESLDVCSGEREEGTIRLHGIDHEGAV